MEAYDRARRAAGPRRRCQCKCQHPAVGARRAGRALRAEHPGDQPFQHHIAVTGHAEGTRREREDGQQLDGRREERLGQVRRRLTRRRRRRGKHGARDEQRGKPVSRCLAEERDDMPPPDRRDEQRLCEHDGQGSARHRAGGVEPEMLVRDGGRRVDAAAGQRRIRRWQARATRPTPQVRAAVWPPRRPGRRPWRPGAAPAPSAPRSGSGRPARTSAIAAHATAPATPARAMRADSPDLAIQRW